jgi:hypothetical protein
MRLPSTANLREHWAAKAKRASEHRAAARMVLGTRARGFVPAIVTLTRVAPRRLDDDNLAAAFKNIRDGVADAIGVDDRDPRITWLYEQTAGNYAVRISLQGGDAATEARRRPEHRESRWPRQAELPLGSRS